MNQLKLKDYRTFVYKLRFSLELETEFPEKIDIMLLRKRYRKLLHSWTVVTDTSMDNGLEFKPKDNNKLHFNKECLAEISEILHIIRKHNGKVDGKKCGLHIHIDASKLSTLELLKIAKEIIAKQSYIIRDFKVQKNRLSHYCQPITKRDIKGLTTEMLEKFRKDINLQFLPNILNSKYYLLNFLALQEHNTIEFRLFNGTKYLREIKKTIRYIFEFLINALERE